MIDIYFGKAAFEQAYKNRENRKTVWLFLDNTDGETIYIKNYSKWGNEFLEKCKKENIEFESIGLQYKSNKFSMNCEGYDRLYAIKSVFGKMGSTPKACYSIGIVKGKKISKKIIATPELVELDSYEDSIEECFEEGFLYYYGKTKARSIQ